MRMPIQRNRSKMCFLFLDPSINNLYVVYLIMYVYIGRPHGIIVAEKPHTNTKYCASVCTRTHIPTGASPRRLNQNHVYDIASV